MGSGVMIYMPSFLSIGLGIQKLIGRGYTDKQRGWRSHKPNFYFFKIRKVALKLVQCVLISWRTYYIIFTMETRVHCN
jgi:hypothetical protein